MSLQDSNVKHFDIFPTGIGRLPQWTGKAAVKVHDGFGGNATGRQMVGGCERSRRG